MVGNVAWFIVLSACTVAVTVVLRVGHQPATATSAATTTRRLAWTIPLGALAGLLLLAGLYRAEALAQVDADVVKRLAGPRTDTLVDVMSAVTTMGDVVPCLLIAGGLALVIFRQGVHPVACWLLPVLVIVEVYLQVGIADSFDDFTMADLGPEVLVGGSGSIPSGSVARFTAMTLVAARLWRSYDARGAERLVSIGGLFVLTELTTRLYLGRHLVADIVAGMLAGLFLAMLFNNVLDLALARYRRQRTLQA